MLKLLHLYLRTELATASASRALRHERREAAGQRRRRGEAVDGEAVCREALRGVEGLLGGVLRVLYGLVGAADSGASLGCLR